MIYENIRLYRLRVEPRDNIDDIYISSDWHIGHDKEFIWKVRGFSDMNSYTKWLVETSQKEFDGKNLILLGDNVWSKNYVDYFYDATKTCKNVFFINGNHGPSQWSRPLRSNMIPIDSATVLCGIKGVKYTPLTHYPIMLNPFNEFINLCGHMHGSSGFIIKDKKSPTATVDCGIDNAIKECGTVGFKLSYILERVGNIK